ncbi:response regulator transcription factor [Paenalkalicoccus suaedae]|uniref:Response regulator transcription factor n=1 Tax=Paenalkalicoccus suaedae TaxID=2592382 RepID=A0A859FBN2_9BACI|nr:response regulator transcription factor [Paenalkalicoccus suaedae]QKS70370.1 response regulator transcription factor [Paenalkalicoccus suaedae]
MGNKILIVEDDKDIRDLTAFYLAKKGYEVDLAEDGLVALNKVKESKPCLVLLDVLLPGMEGYEVCEKIREELDVPIIFLSCKRSSTDKIRGLHAGGDDYLTKPFDMAELEARIQAILRRHSLRTVEKEETTHHLQIRDIRVDLASFDVQVKGKSISLYAKELQLLLFLMKHPNQVFSAEQIYQQIWDVGLYGDIKTVSVHIRNLRKKIEDDPANPSYIKTLRGFGYKFVHAQ